MERDGAQWSAINRNESQLSAIERNWGAIGILAEPPKKGPNGPPTKGAKRWVKKDGEITFGTVHGNGTDGVLTQVLGDLENKTATGVVLDLKGVENSGQVLLLELDVDDGTDNRAK